MLLTHHDRNHVKKMEKKQTKPRNPKIYFHHHLILMDLTLTE